MTWIVKCNQCGKQVDAVMVDGRHTKPANFLQAKLFNGQIIDACSVECATELGKVNEVDDPNKPAEPPPAETTGG